MAHLQIVLNGAWVKMLCEVAPTARRYEQGDVACATKVSICLSAELLWP